MPKEKARLTPLKAGDTIAIVGLSTGTTQETLTKGSAYLESKGFKLKSFIEEQRVPGSYGGLFSRALPESRAKALMQFFRDEEVKAVLSLRGGYGCAEILPYLDFSIFKKHPKIFVGLSDITSLLNALWQQSELPSIHAPALIGYGSRAAENADASKSCEALLAFCGGSMPNAFTDVTLDHVSGPKEAAGRLFGGNLSMLASMCGTPWAVSADKNGGLLFLEEIGEPPYRIHRMLTQLEYAGVYKNVKGVIVGSFDECNGKGRVTWSDTIRDVFGRLGLPLFFGLPVGHGDLSLPIPIGVQARIASNKLEFDYPVVLN